DRMGLQRQLRLGRPTIWQIHHRPSLGFRTAVTQSLDEDRGPDLAVLVLLSPQLLRVHGEVSTGLGSLDRRRRYVDGDDAAPGVPPLHAIPCQIGPSPRRSVALSMILNLAGFPMESLFNSGPNMVCSQKAAVCRLPPFSEPAFSAVRDGRSSALERMTSASARSRATA